MRRLEHCNIVKLKYFFYSSGEKVRTWRLFTIKIIYSSSSLWLIFFFLFFFFLLFIFCNQNLKFDEKKILKIFHTMISDQIYLRSQIWEWFLVRFSFRSESRAIKIWKSFLSAFDSIVFMILLRILRKKKPS